jgi:NAD-dependent SIR2 family protein deacetylase
MIILKNKKKTIEVATVKLATGGQIFASAQINNDGAIIKLTSDPDGNFEIEDKKKISLKDYIEKEKRDFYKNLLQNKYSEIENIVILSGAGSSVGIGNAKKGLAMSGLWDLFEKEDPKTLKNLIIATGHDITNKDLEALLSIAGVNNIVNKGALKDEIEKVKKFIVENCSLDLPPNSPHEFFLNKVTLRPQKYPRIKLFTLNYDTLFEQAASKEMLTIIDGFTFSNPREFNGKYFDYDIIETRHNRQDKKDSTISKLFYLFKMHGSLSWQKKDKKIIQADSTSIAIDDRVMIFPQDSKYEHSYEQPYFEMMARFQQTLRTENTLLVTIGFSFVDKHISSVILESLKQNPSLNLIAFSYPEVIAQDYDYQKELHLATEQSRITLVGETFENLAEEYPENRAHKRTDVLEELGKLLNK